MIIIIRGEIHKIRRFAMLLLCLTATAVYSQNMSISDNTGWFLDLYTGTGLGSVVKRSGSAQIDLPVKAGPIVQPLIGFETGRWLSPHLNMSIGMRYQVKGYLDQLGSKAHETKNYWMGLLSLEYKLLKRLSWQMGMSLGKGFGTLRSDNHREIALLNNLKYHPARNWGLSLGYNRGMNPLPEKVHGHLYNYSFDLIVHYRLNRLRIIAY